MRNWLTPRRSQLSHASSASSGGGAASRSSTVTSWLRSIVGIDFGVLIGDSAAEDDVLRDEALHTTVTAGLFVAADNMGGRVPYSLLWPLSCAQ